MCYPKPGPRCSAHAAKAYTRLLVEGQALAHAEMAREDKMASIDNHMKKRKKAQAEYEATPAGMAHLELQIRESEGSYAEHLQNRLADARTRRAAALRAIKMKDSGDIQDHPEIKTRTVYNQLGLRTDFDATSTPRVGWDVDSDKFKTTGAVLMKASDLWTRKMTPDQIAATTWLTGSGTLVLNRHAHGQDQVGREAESLSSEEIDNRARLVKEAFDAAPMLPEPVVLYRGIGPNSPFDLKKTVESSEYVVPSVSSTTLNPGVANSFGYAGSDQVILEMKTRRFASPTNFAGGGVREAEVLIPAGARFRVVNVIKDVEFGWSKDNMSKGYTVVQMEEVEEDLTGTSD